MDVLENLVAVGFMMLARYRDELARATDDRERAELQRLIAETQDHLVELRRAAYGPIIACNRPRPMAPAPTRTVRP